MWRDSRHSARALASGAPPNLSWAHAAAARSSGTWTPPSCARTVRMAATRRTKERVTSPENARRVGTRRLVGSKGCPAHHAAGAPALHLLAAVARSWGRCGTLFFLLPGRSGHRPGGKANSWGAQKAHWGGDDAKTAAVLVKTTVTRRASLAQLLHRAVSGQGALSRAARGFCLFADAY